MSALLDDIISHAVDGKQPLPDILRKCLLLGHELKNERLKEWANQELNGYKSGKDVPEYRIMPAQAHGNFIGPFYAQLNSHIIPPVALEKEHRQLAERVYLLQSISAYADVVNGATSRDRNLILSWPANMVAYYQEKLRQNGYVCHAAWQELPVNALVELIDTVRNLTLNMALGIKDELGTSYAHLNRIKPEEIERVKSVVINNLGGNVALGDVDASGSTVIIAGDRKTLDAALTKAGMNQTDLTELSEAIHADGNEVGSKVTKWIGDKAEKLLIGGVKMATSIAQQVLTDMLMQHCGLKH